MFKLERVPARVIGAAVIATLVAGTGVGAEAATKKKHRKPIIRTVTLAYQGGCGYQVVIAGNGPSATPSSCVTGDSYTLALKPGEKYISVSVADDYSPAVPGILWLSSGLGDAQSQPFCSSIKNFVATGTQPSLDLVDGVASDCPGSAFTGTIKVTYSSIPIK